MKQRYELMKMGNLPLLIFLFFKKSNSIRIFLFWNVVLRRAEPIRFVYIWPIYDMLLLEIVRMEINVSIRMYLESLVYLDSFSTLEHFHSYIQRQIRGFLYKHHIQKILQDCFLKKDLHQMLSPDIIQTEFNFTLKWIGKNLLIKFPHTLLRQRNIDKKLQNLLRIRFRQRHCL